MAMNAQHKRVNKNRVSITYDVEVNGESENRNCRLLSGWSVIFPGINRRIKNVRRKTGNLPALIMTILMM